MLNGFDWLRRSRTGAELLSTLRYLATKPALPSDEGGPPHSALDGPCRRCWIYPRVPTSRRDLPDETIFDWRAAPYCPVCSAVMAGASRLGGVSRRSIAVWAHVNRLPRQLQPGGQWHDCRVLGSYIHGDNHFLLMMERRELKPWLRELVLYHGPELKGLLQVLPTTGGTRGPAMSDLLCRAHHQEGRFALDQLRVRFFSAPYQLLIPHERDKKGMLTFEITDFIGLLEMASVFRTLLRPEAQEALRALLDLSDPQEEQFYWGRFLGYLSPESRDMLHAWRIRQWPKGRIQLLYELVEYVSFYETA